MLDPARQLGRGVAFGTGSPSHLLNVRTIGMSAIAEQPAHFLQWAQGQGLTVTGSEFLPRHRYASYLRDALAAAQMTAAPLVTLEHRRRLVTGIRQRSETGTFEVALDDGTALAAHQVVLATGNRPPRPRWLPDHPSVFGDPWRPGVAEAVSSMRSVLIVGSGLTAVDVVLSLRDRGFRGTAHLISTHGLLPAAHHDQVPTPRPPAVRPGEDAARTARGLVRALRADATTADDWRQTVDGLRPVTVELWRDLPPDEQRRAMRHAMRHWEVRRHRMAPQVAAAVDELLRAGRITLGRGRVERLEAFGDAIRATVDHRGSSRTRDVDAAIVCVGPAADPAADPFLARLLATGIAARHPLGMGLDVERDGRVRAADGNAWSRLWAVGSLRKGAEWESTAVPELRLHARDLAASLLGTDAVPRLG